MGLTVSQGGDQIQPARLETITRYEFGERFCLCKRVWFRSYVSHASMARCVRGAASEQGFLRATSRWLETVKTEEQAPETEMAKPSLVGRSVPFSSSLYRPVCLGRTCSLSETIRRVEPETTAGKLPGRAVAERWHLHDGGSRAHDSVDVVTPVWRLLW